MALIMVTAAPAVNAWPAGDEGCDGEPPADICGSRKLPVVPNPRFTLSWRLRSKINGRTEEFNRSGCMEGLRVKRWLSVPSTRLAWASGRTLRWTYHFS